ncbi:sensor histidine kinase [Pseudonocardia xinjiangensis]|uniref:sensor histidine kinase n=1 Tax=Pseudonocardia xinjiangensis TaxID=75289 RepID=UPI003D938D30
MRHFVALGPRPDARRRRAVFVDAASAAALACLAAYTPLDPPGPPYPGPAWAALLVGAAAGSPLLLRRRRSVPVLVWVVLVAVSATVLGVVGAGAVWATYAPVAVAMYTVANLSSRTIVAAAVLVAGLGAAAAAIPAFYWIHRPADRGTAGSEVPLWWQVELGIVVVLLSAAWAAGRVVRSRRVAEAEFARRSAREAVADERLRIARELHDVLGHSMSLITIKATVAGRLADEDPEHAKAALSAIEQTSRAAMTEIRQLLGVLRPASDEVDRPSTADGAGDAERGPLPGSADLPVLIDRFRATDLEIDLELSGTGTLPPGVDLAVFRVVQEALTNVVKHAAARHCRVVVRRTTESVRIEVVDDGPVRRALRRRPGGGHGLIGMRERIAAYGGTLTVGPLTDGGFQVVADIPRVVPDAAP